MQRLSPPLSHLAWSWCAGGGVTVVVASVVVAAGSGGFDKGPRPLSLSLCHVDLRKSRVQPHSPSRRCASPLPRLCRGSRGATSTLNRRHSTCRRLTTSRPRNPLVGHDLGHDDPPPPLGMGQMAHAAWTPSRPPRPRCARLYAFGSTFCSVQNV